jgi:hypothetical protein
MRNRLPASLPLVIVMFAAVAASALRAGARRPESREVLSTEPPPVTATAEDSLPQPAVTAVTAAVHYTAGQEGAKPPGALGRPDASIDQMQYVFHELHADGRHALCEVCANQYRH